MYKLYLSKAKTKNASGGIEEDGLEGIRLEGTVAEVEVRGVRPTCLEMEKTGLGMG